MTIKEILSELENIIWGSNKRKKNKQPRDKKGRFVKVD